MGTKEDFYRNFSINFREQEHEKFRHEIKDTTSKYEYQLLNLIKKVPLWETHLNERQTEIVKMFITTKNASMVDEYLKLSTGTAWHTLFGKQGNSGVLGKLKKIDKKLNEL